MTQFEVSEARTYCSFVVCGICIKEQWLTFRDTLVIWGAAIPGGDEKARLVDYKLNS